MPKRIMLVHGVEGGRIWLDVEKVDVVHIPDRLGDASVTLRSGFRFMMPRETAQKLIDMLGEGAENHWR